MLPQAYLAQKVFDVLYPERAYLRVHFPELYKPHLSEGSIIANATQQQLAQLMLCNNSIIRELAKITWEYKNK